jgi:pimeloyl-ACP methyl ester carboxylesterase
VSPRPAVLALEPDPVLAFLHLPQGGDGHRTAVLFCPPFGWEEMCSYRARRVWAQALADAGHPTARFNLPSTGDSAGSVRDPTRLDSWIGAVDGTARWLREITGVRRVAALGIGLGGLLACRAACADAPIDDLILWAVPARGRLLLREMRAYAGVVASGLADDVPDSGGEGELELTGFVITGDTARALEAVRLDALELPAADRRRVLLLERDGIPPDKRLRTHLEQAGAAVTVTASDEYTAMMADPQHFKVPQRTIATTIDWLAECPAPTVSEPPARPLVERDRIELRSPAATLRETPLRLDGEGDEAVFGVLCEPVDAEPATVCMVWLNGGALQHIGPNRIYVEAARRWAARGIPTVRVDLRGIGDSDGAEGLLANPSLYAHVRTEETLSVLDQLAARGIAERFVLGGLCSGAYWSLHAALTNPRVVGAMLINLYSFYWSEELVRERDTQAAMSRFRRTGWRRVARLDIRRELVRKAVRTMRPGRVRASARWPVETAQAKRVDAALDALRDRDTETLFLFAEDEPLYDQFVRQGQLERLQRWPNVTIERIPSTDHMFRAIGLQRGVHDSLDHALDRVLSSVPNRPRTAHR